MKKILVGCSLIILVISGCGKYIAGFSTTSCTSIEPANAAYSKASELEKVLEEFIERGVPGVALGVLSSEGYWASAKGYARLENKTLMQVCHLQYLQSISKTYMAVAILKLGEQGKINLDEPMTKYLPGKYHRYVTDGNKVTVRMLLNHTSGIPEYNFAPAYVTVLLQNPSKDFMPEDYLRYIEGKELKFEPGSKHVYTNTNYVLLALIVDAISGDQSRFISETIFAPLSLQNTFYSADGGYLKYPRLVNSYWDRYSNSILENVSELQRNNVENLAGDDGIVTTPSDAVKFLRALVDGSLLSPESLKQMKTWTTNKEGKPVYGLGLGYREINGISGFGHSGAGIGAGAELYYFPDKNVCYFIAINLGTVTASPLHKEVEKTLDNLHDILLR